MRVSDFDTYGIMRLYRIRIPLYHVHVYINRALRIYVNIHACIFPRYVSQATYLMENYAATRVTRPLIDERGTILLAIAI